LQQPENVNIQTTLTSAEHHDQPQNLKRPKTFEKTQVRVLAVGHNLYPHQACQGRIQDIEIGGAWSENIA
jgi:hypothetical protein